MESYNINDSNFYGFFPKTLSVFSINLMNPCFLFYRLVVILCTGRASYFLLLAVIKLVFYPMWLFLIFGAKCAELITTKLLKLCTFLPSKIRQIERVCWRQKTLFHWFKMWLTLILA